MLVFFMLGGALRSAGDARTPMVLGITMTALNVGFNIIFIRGLGPIPGIWNGGGRHRNGDRVRNGGGVRTLEILARRLGGVVPARTQPGTGLVDHSLTVPLRLPTGFQGIAMNIGGVLLLSFIGSVAHGAAAQAAFAISYSQLFSLITWTSVGLMGAAAAVAGQNLGAGQPTAPTRPCMWQRATPFSVPAFVGFFFLVLPRQLLAVFGMNEPTVVAIGVQLLRVLSVSGLLIAVALTYTGGCKARATRRVPLYISIVSQIVVPLGICFAIKRLGTLDPIDIWFAILVGHFTRCMLSIWRFNQGKWRSIDVSLRH
jgi:Na+-driven multidrug efflux pump